MTFVNFDGEPFATNQMSVFFVAVTNPLTDTSVELGDGFVREVRFNHCLFGRDLCGKTKKGVWGPKMERAWTCQKWFRGKMTSSCASTYHSGISKDLRTHVASCRVRMTWRNHNEDNQEEHKKSDLSSRQRKERPLQFQSGGQIRRSSFDLQVSKPWQKTGHWSFWKWTCQFFKPYEPEKRKTLMTGKKCWKLMSSDDEAILTLNDFMEESKSAREESMFEKKHGFRNDCAETRVKIETTRTPVLQSG